jgi:16S rRNA pseudouridine516 synthase
MRLDRLLGNLGYGSRPQVQRLVRTGRVAVGGASQRDPTTHVDPASVTLDGQSLDHPDGIVVALHKPIGYVCSHADEEGPSVYDLLPAHWAGRLPRPEAVGRLDRDTSGLLIVTDDHQLLHRLTSPKHHVTKTYVATLARPMSPELLAAFASGELVLRGEDHPCGPAEVQVLDELTARVTLTEGRYHQVRRMFAACGNHVEALHRTAVGPWTLDDLPAGLWRDVSATPPA